MKTPPEVFKGIEFVRISALPADQKEQIWKSFQQDKIIKIVRDQALMNDCILYQDYLNWLVQRPAHQSIHDATTAREEAMTAPAYIKLAFK